MSEFDRLPYPNRPKILFVGTTASTHTHAWVELLDDAPFNVRVFSTPAGDPPPEWPVRCYVTTHTPHVPYRDDDRRRTLFPPRPNSPAYPRYVTRELVGRAIVASDAVAYNAFGTPESALQEAERATDPISPEEALAHVIQKWRPDVIHTLGIDDSSYFYLRTRDTYGLSGIGHWVVQARGGPDIALLQYQPEHRPRIQEVLATCDHFVADNEKNYAYARDLGLAPHKSENPSMGVVPGTGGLDLKAFRARWTLPPSQRDRIIVWPKAYEVTSSKAMPVFEAILKVWDRIQPCRIEMLWMVQAEVRGWYERLFPESIKAHCKTHPHLPRDETLDLLSRARVMMAPSLSDGVPNTMMEAMALGAVPLMSPIETITPVVENEQNVLFARNLYPDEIADALVRLMTDDALVDYMASQNVVHIYRLADRRRIRARVVEFYEEVARQARA